MRKKISIYPLEELHKILLAEAKEQKRSLNNLILMILMTHFKEGELE